jgi:endonuclease YncB( thermonuclease family)
MLFLAQSASVALSRQTDADAEAGMPINATVDRVVDGSSLDTHVAGKRTAVGYLGAETPALNQPCGREALERNQQLAGDGVVLVSDPNYEFDDIGRRLYYAFTTDGVWIDETLVREGLARAGRPDATHGADLAVVQAEAEAAASGCLWATD